MPVAADYFSQHDLDALCEHMLQDKGQSIRSFFEAGASGKTRAGFYMWMEKHALPEQVDQLAHVARARETLMAEDILDIADDSRNDTMTNRHGEEVADTEWIARSKLRVESRFKLLAIMNPKKYGAKVTNEHTGADGGPIKTLDLTMTPQEAKAISQALDDEC